MSARPQPQPTLYEQLEALPEGLTGEIALEGGAWRKIGRFAGAARVSLPPFEAVTINLEDL